MSRARAASAGAARSRSRCANGPSDPTSNASRAQPSWRAARASASASLGLAGDLVAEAGQLDAGQPGERRCARQLDRAQRRGDPRPIGRPDLAPQIAHPARRHLGQRRRRGIRRGGQRGQRRDVVGQRRQALAPFVGDGGAAEERDRICRRLGSNARRRGARRRHGGRRRARPTRRATDRARAPAAAAAWRTPRAQSRPLATSAGARERRASRARLARADHQLGLESSVDLAQEGAEAGVLVGRDPRARHVEERLHPHDVAVGAHLEVKPAERALDLAPAFAAERCRRGFASPPAGGRSPPRRVARDRRAPGPAVAPTAGRRSARSRDRARSPAARATFGRSTGRSAGR